MKFIAKVVLVLLSVPWLIVVLGRIAGIELEWFMPLPWQVVFFVGVWVAVDILSDIYIGPGDDP